MKIFGPPARPPTRVNLATQGENLEIHVDIPSFLYTIFFFSQFIILLIVENNAHCVVGTNTSRSQSQPRLLSFALAIGRIAIV